MSTEAQALAPAAAQSILHRRSHLGELVDLPSFRELCKSFSELYGIGIKVFDAQGQKLVDLRAQTGEYCAHMFGSYETKLACTKLVGFIKACEVEDVPTVPVECFSGLRYRIAPLILEGDLVGRVIYGPFRPDTLLSPPDSLAKLAADMNQAKATELLVQIKPIADPAIDGVVRHCQQVLDALIFAGYKTLTVSQMHIESITLAYGDLEEKNKNLTATNEKLREMDRMKSNFIATVSHELRTPLTSVIGYSEMLLEGLAGSLTEEQREYVSTIMEKGESLLHLITSILDLSKIESGAFSLRREQIDISAVIRTAISDVLPQARKKSIHLVSDVKDDLGPFSIDEEKFHRSVTNLLANAVKFTPANGRVELSAGCFEGSLPQDSGKIFDPFSSENNHWLLISVRDTGIGIPPDKLKLVFEPFFQVDSSSTREYGGTGLGLAIVRNFVEAHGGAVWAESEAGKGSVFNIALPSAAKLA